MGLEVYEASELDGGISEVDGQIDRETNNFTVVHVQKHRGKSSDSKFGGDRSEPGAIHTANSDVRIHQTLRNLIPNRLEHFTVPAPRGVKLQKFYENWMESNMANSLEIFVEKR